MTNEQAIKIIKQNCYVFNPLDFDESTMINRALDVAVKALEQEPCREQDDYENEIEDLHNRLDIAEYDKERLREEVTEFEEKIKALEQEPCEDCISREQTKAEIRKAFPQLKDRVEINSILNGLPSVKQEPCEEREKGECPYYAG